MTENEFKERTKQIALRVIRLVDSLPPSVIAHTIGKQLLRSGTSIGANYRAACRGKSRADTAHKLAIVEEEADESIYWIELLVDANLIFEGRVTALSGEIKEIVAMTVASIKTMRRNSAGVNPKSKIQNPKSKMKSWIALNMTPGVGPRVATKLLEAFGSPDNVFHARRTQLESLRIKPETIESIIKRELFERASIELERVKKLGGDILLLDDGSYPEMLREIADPPITLYVRGEWEACLTLPCVAVIGSRLCSTYGINATEMLSRDLASRGICVISGLARGIDTAAHRSAMSGGGKTVAVLGTGIDGAYPKENARLIKEILDSGGAVVSQFPLGTPPLKDNFPYRNRIISGLCLGVLIVEASERSGSLITARLAIEQDREVMAVPGNITSANSFGTNYLIKSGAKLVQQWQDVVAELPSEIAAAILPPKIEEEIEIGRNDISPPDMSVNERKIWSLLSYDEPRQIDVLLESSGMSFGDLNTALVALDIRDLIRVLPGKNYARRI